MDNWMLEDPQSDAIAMMGYSSLFSPEGAAHIGRTITGIFELLKQVGDEIETLKARVKELEDATPPPPASTE